ncbi:MAG: multicopper oxidase family protein [Pseudomonadota bacterium]
MITLSRRQLLAGAGAAALVTATAPLGPRARAEDMTVLRAETRQIEVAGRPATVFGLRQPDGRPGLTTVVGRDFAVRLENRLAESTVIHWHGLTPPWRLDGVPGLSQEPLEPGAAQDYRFPLQHPGTYWMHSHHGLQEQALLAAPLIVAAAEPKDEQEVVLLIHDFSFKPADEILAGLKAASGHAAAGSDTNMSNMDMSNMTGMDMAGMNHGAMPGMGETMGTGAEDINDIEYDAYLVNDRTLDDPEVVPVERGGTVRLRIINGATATAFTIDLGAIEGELVAVDGQPVQPVKGARFPISMGQRLDILLQVPKDAGALPILALREGEEQRTGMVLQPKGAPVTKLGSVGEREGPILDLMLERSLRALEPLAPRPADRTVGLDLVGNMTAYAWGLKATTGDGPIPVKAGERVEVTMGNSSMMAHPMHLHGHRFQVVAIDGERFAGAMRDTVLVPPRKTVTIAFDADNPGRWAFHCHHLYHAEAGMMTTVAYEGV